ncbi:hypothetical protein COV24_04345 [candidate division WWE3 bacterium CG10_big_fil_rev_8_21_14_0_10_32_10]|uniref:AI-2E family transporter n=1 Tax=candidate division WWE3 bacterium CG10_big_fil_rev_8_21_14_0_10_32_10 TaxID=1975090 RepID=A0A2H0R9V2_UNCKA|nr:MAG: hypothetical protein COV24_04345 [candidate division WWE3 bacterium CG10_big_fil_rev_8_21_14_0_10_32_10]
MKNHQIVIDTKAILTLLAVLASVWVASQTKTIIIALFIALIIAFGLNPAVEFLLKKGLPRNVSVILIYFAFLIVVFGIGALAVTPMVNQSIALANNFPKYLENLSKIPELAPYTQNLNTKITEQLSNIGTKALQTTVGAFSGVLLSLTILVFTAYLLIDFVNIKKYFIKLIPKSGRKDAEDITEEVEIKLGHWLRGQITLMLIIGIMSYIGLLILGVNYAPSLALIAGLLEMVPIVGPIISVIPALIVGFGQSPIQGIGVIGLYIIVQQLENNFIVPKVMQKAVGFNPLITMLAILIGGSVLGVVGALIAVPVTLVSTIILKVVYKHLY